MIEINNLTTSPVDEKFLKKVALKVLEEEKKGKQALSIALIGPARMRKLNKKYLGKNRVTDVLAFGQNQKFPILPKKELGLGEIVICLREVKKNAKKFAQSFEKELADCLIHGILHLLGYNHEISLEKGKKMKEKQKYYLEKLFK